MRSGIQVMVWLAALCIAWPAAGRQQEKRAAVECGERCEVRLSTNRLLEIRHDEPDVQLRFGGRFHLDGAAFIDDVTPMSNGWLVRRGRPEFRARLFEIVKLKVDYDFASNRSGWRNLWGRVTPRDFVWVQGGNFIAPFGLEDDASSNHSLFMERSIASALSPSFQTGGAVGVRGHFGKSKRRHRYTLSTMVGTAPLAALENDRHKSEHVAVTARATWAPITKKRRVLHFGGSLEYRSLADASTWRVRTRPESSIAAALLNTGRLTDVASSFSGALEAAWLRGPISVQGEFMSTRLQRRAGAANARLWGAYGQIGWLLTGEHRRYSRTTARIRGPIPDRAFGAVEVGVRVSHLDLVDRDISGGRATDVTFGLNWFLRQNLRVMFNYIFVDARLPTTLETDRPHVFQGRFAVFF